jgi:hypothetical protein
VTSAKYLGCTITSDDLKWGPHINNICNKANPTIGFLKRNLNIANKSVKERAYQSLVRPSLEYSSAVWDPHQQQDKQRLERIQRRAVRYVTNRYHNTSSVSDMLDQLEWPSLESRRTNSRLTMMYKMTKNLANVDTSDKLIPLQRPSRNCNTLAFSIPSCRTSIRKESFYPRTTKDWNALKDASVGAPSLEAVSAVFNLAVNIPHTNFVVFTCAHPNVAE